MKQHPVYEHLHVTEDGRIYSTKTNKFLKTLINSGGYEVFCTKLDGRSGPSKLLRVHRLVAETYLENEDNRPFVNHLDGIKNNNHFTNLQWVTSSENAQHAWKLGLQKPILRDSNPFAKLTTEILEEIRQRYIPYHREHGLRSIAKEYGVSHTRISEGLAGLPRIEQGFPI